MALWIAMDEDGHGTALFKRKPKKDKWGYWGHARDTYDDDFITIEKSGIKHPPIKPGECIKVELKGTK